MNLDEIVSPIRRIAFRMWRRLAVATPGGRSRAFGTSDHQIGAVLVINLDRQPRRWQRVTAELGRIRTAQGAPLTTLTSRLSAIDARDGRAVAATADVDVMYRVGDQLYVQPDARLAESFSEDEPVRMTRQEVAVARSHIEAWKAISSGTHPYVLVLEDDIWFRPGAAGSIDRGWQAASERAMNDKEPHLIYLSYTDAGGTAARTDICEHLFRPIRGLWCLSGYVLSREGAEILLRALPVVGPVDLWMNYRFAELHTLALTSAAIAQRQDGTSDNAYSILPYLARAGTIDAGHPKMAPSPSRTKPVLAWTAHSEHESLAMALSMLGLRVRVFDKGDDDPLDQRQLAEAFETFDALIDVPLTPAAAAATAAAANAGTSVHIIESGAVTPAGMVPHRVGPPHTAGATTLLSRGSWDVLCEILDLEMPVDLFPSGGSPKVRLFRDDRLLGLTTPAASATPAKTNRHASLDDSPWVLPSAANWHPRPSIASCTPAPNSPIVRSDMASLPPSLRCLVETFPGNLASFRPERLNHNERGTDLVLERSGDGRRPYESAAFASRQTFKYGHFEVDIKAAQGPGLITGFFLHREAPRQEIDIELSGAEPRRMLTNVFFNPGDDNTTMGFGYRGTPHWIDLDFDVTEDFHLYAIDWEPGCITWTVDGRIVHQRLGWDPTPVPHLDMMLHGNLWAPRSTELAGRVDPAYLPATATFRNISVATHTPHSQLGTSTP